jgi:hypothetical protein
MQVSRDTSRLQARRRHVVSDTTAISNAANTQASYKNQAELADKHNYHTNKHHSHRRNQDDFPKTTILSTKEKRTSPTIRYTYSKYSEPT